MKTDAFTAAGLIERIGQLVRADEQVGDLNPVQWSALRYLSQANRFSRTPIALSRYLNVTRGTVSQTLIALERKGYVSRVPSDRDKRSVEIELMEKGRRALTDDPILKLEMEVQTSLGTGSGAFGKQLAKLLEQLIKRNDGRPFGQCFTCRHFKRGGSDSNNPHFCTLLEVDLSDSDSMQICVEQETA